MPGESRFTYTKDEQELIKVIANLQQEIKELDYNNRRDSLLLDDAIARAEDIAKKRGITDEQMNLIRIQAESSAGTFTGVKDPMRSWNEIVAEADKAILGNVVLEDICSEQDFEDAARHINDIEKEFKARTRLTKTDLVFIPIAIALQCLRQYVLQPFLDTHRLTHQQGDRIKKIVVPKNLQEILCGSVPYDAITKRDKDSDSTGLGGSTHRYRTLGHDPVLGWFFGPVNILSNSLTKTDFITSYEITDMKIGSQISTLKVIEDAHEQASIEFNLPVSIIRQAIHFGSDYFTKQGLPIPFISYVNNDVSKFLINNNINMLNVTEGFVLSSFINFMVSCIHKLFNKDVSPELYEVRTRKILSISNTFASASNIVCVAITKNAKILDIGGLLVTIRRLFTDIRFIARLKQEFIEGKLDEEWKTISEEIDRL
jgi:hypothetical protein